MSPAIRRRLDALAERQHEVALLLAEPQVLADAARFRALSKEFAHLDPLARASPSSTPPASRSMPRAAC